MRMVVLGVCINVTMQYKGVECSLDVRLGKIRQELFSCFLDLH